MSDPINLTGEGQEAPQQPASGGRSDSDSDVDSDHGDPGVLGMSNGPDPAAGASSHWQRLKWAAPTKGKSSPDWKFFLVGGEDANKNKALCKIGTCGSKAVVSASATSNLKRHLDNNHKEDEEYAKQRKKRALAEDTKASGKDGGIMKYLGSEQAAVHRRLVLGFIVGGLKSISVVDEPDFKAMLRGFAKNNNLEIPGRSTLSAHSVLQVLLWPCAEAA